MKKLNGTKLFRNLTTESKSKLPVIVGLAVGDNPKPVPMYFAHSMYYRNSKLFRCFPYRKPISKII